jgi:hypothetical protein
MVFDKSLVVYLLTEHVGIRGLSALFCFGGTGV